MRGLWGPLKGCAIDLGPLLTEDGGGRASQTLSEGSWVTGLRDQRVSRRKASGWTPGGWAQSP